MSEKQSNKFLRKIVLDSSKDPTTKTSLSNELIDHRYLFPRVIAVNLFEQFHRLSNIWFLLISIIQLLPYNMSSNASWSTIVPLSVLLSISLSKDLYNSYKFTSTLKKVNETKFPVWNGKTFIDLESKHLSEGMIVMLAAGQTVPADMVLICRKSLNDLVFLDSSNLIGSFSVFEKFTIEAIENETKIPESENKDLSSLLGEVKVPEPHADYSSFAGTLKLHHHPKAAKIGSKNFLIAGGVIKGSENVIGVVVYCGNDTKFKLNSPRIKKKFTRVERLVNKWMFFNFGIILVMVVISIIGFFTDYRSENSDSVIMIFLQFLTLYSNLIPISLFVTIDIIRLVQALIYQKLNPGVHFNNESLNENLGQIEYLVTDKTFTLTKGKFKLSSFLIRGQRFSGSTEKLASSFGTEHALSGFDKSQDDQAFEDFLKAIHQDSYNEIYHHFVRCLCLCNSLVQANKELVGCPIDLALLRAAEKLGYRTDIGAKRDVNLYFASSFRNYKKIINLLPQFGRNRKSVIVQDYSDSCGYIYTRGSARSMMAAISVTEDEKNILLEEIARIESFGNSAWILAFNEIPFESLSDIKKKLKKNQKTLLNIQGRINFIFENLEKNMKVLAVVGINEKLQDEVANTFEFLQRAGIKIWLASSDSHLNSLCTAFDTRLVNDCPLMILRNVQNDVVMGKKLEAAIRSFIMEEFELEPVGVFGSQVYSSIRPEIEQEEYNVEEQHIQRLTERLNFQASFNINPDIENNLNEKVELDVANFAVVIDRTSFLTAIKVDKLKKLLTCLLACAKNVCFTEMLPIDKYHIAKLLKENMAFNPCVAVVGSTFSDLSMSHESDISIGVLNNKNSLFFSYTDINISTFSQIRDLMIQGHHFYYRMSKVVLLHLHKNFILAIVQFAFNIYAGFSGTSAYEASLLVGFNLFFTTFPYIYLGIMDQDISYRKIKNKPEVYSQGIFGQLFTWKHLSWYFFLAVVQSVIIVLLSYQILPFVLFSNGQGENFLILTCFVFITLVFTVNLWVLIETFTVSFWYFLSFVLSFLCLLVFFSIASNTDFISSDSNGIGEMLKISGYTGISIVFTSFVSIVPGLFVFFYRRVIGASVADMVNSDEDVFLKTSRLSYFQGKLSQLYRRSESWSSKIQDEQIIVKKFSLKLTPRYLDRKYARRFIRINLKEYKIKIFIGLIICLIFMIYVASMRKIKSSYSVTTMIGSCVGIFLLVSLFSKTLRKYYREIIIIIILILEIARFIIDISYNITDISYYSLLSAFIYLEFNIHWVSILILSIFNFFLSILSLLFTSSAEGSSIILSSEKLIFLFSIIICCGVQGFYTERDKRIEYIYLKTIKSEYFKSNNILSMLLPKFVKNRVKRGARYIAEAKTEVSVIFCDICEFEKICRDYSPQELVIFLDKLFSRFDVLCENHGVIKIETVGKTYMACAGLIDYDQDLATYLRKVPHAKRAVEFSFALIEEVKDIMLKNGESLKVKIGINSGPVTAGVVGYHKPQFSLVGDTVNTASRMCSTLKAFNSIQISSETFNMLQESEDYNFEKITVEAKGKGFLDTFLIDLVRRKSISEELSKGLASRTEIISPLQIFSNNLSQDLNFSSKKKSWRKIIQKAGDSPYLEEYPSFLTGNRKTTLIENRFEKDLQFKSFESTIICLVTAFFTYFLMFFFSFLDYFVSKNSLSPVPIILRGCAMIYLGLICFFFRVLNRLKHKDFVIKPCMVLMYFCSISNLFYSKKVNPDLMCNEILLSFLLLCQSTQSSLIFQLLFSSLQLIIWLLLASLQSSIVDHILYFFLVMIFSIIHIRSLYSKDRIERRNFNLKSIARREIFENTTLLKKLMPKHVLKHLKKELHFTDRLENVTLLYADIVGFTSWSSNKCPNEIVEMLSELFTSFDRLCVELDVYKVCTIGDCYVVMGLSSNGIRNEVLECVNVVKMAFKMIEVINEKNKQHSSKLNMRIGLHTGEVIGGVIGTSIVRYDIWGPDVLIANKMESNGEPGRVKISEDTKEVLDSNLVEGLKFELSDPVDIKSLGLSKQSFFVTCLNDEDLFVNLVK